MLAIVAVGALLGEGESDNIGGCLEQVGIGTGLFCVASLTLGYVGAQVMRLDQP